MKISRKILNVIKLAVMIMASIVVFFLMFGVLLGFVDHLLGGELTSEKSMCIESGFVWDGAEKRCREDCYTWTYEQGCVPLQQDHSE